MKNKDIKRIKIIKPNNKFFYIVLSYYYFKASYLNLYLCQKSILLFLRSIVYYVAKEKKMKQNTIIIILLIGFIPLFGQLAENKVKWYTIKEALELNKKAPRKIIIDVYTNWCGYCKLMDKETFSHPVISEYLNKNFYSVKFNAESIDSVEFGGYKFGNPGQGARSTHQFATALFQAGKIQPGYPAIAYINENLQLLGVIPGYQTPSQIEPILNYINEDKYKTVSLDDYQKSFVSKLKQ